jgi:hypothetical protein
MSAFSSHSADVEMWLDCDGHGRVDLSRITPKSVVARLPRDIPACFADLVVVVDGKRLTKRVRVGGFSKGRAASLIGQIAPF